MSAGNPMNGNGALKKRVLGRGLGALIPGGGDVHVPRTLPDGGSGQRTYFIAPIEDVHPSPDQPRKVFEETALDELARSIKQDGVLQPLVVRSGAPDGGFFLIAGERRWRAAQRAGLHEVPVVVREASPTQAFEWAIVENVQRADLNPIEEAEAYQHLAELTGYTQERLAERVGRDRATVANTMRLLKLPAPVRTMVSDGALQMGHARALLGLEDPSKIEQTARQVVSRGLSTRATEELVRRLKSPPGKAAAAAPAKSVSVRDLEARLSRALAARVRVTDRGEGRGGRIEIDYASLDELDRLLDRMLTSSS